MLLDWPIRTKLKLGLGLLLVTVLALFGSAYYGLYAYRGLVKGLAWRSAELPLTSEIQKSVGILVTLSQAHERLELPFYDEDQLARQSQWLDDEWTAQLAALERGLREYSQQLQRNAADPASRLADSSEEWQALAQINQAVMRLRKESSTALLNGGPTSEFRRNVDELRRLCNSLPTHLNDRMQHLVSDVRSQYRTGIAVAWVNVFVALVLLGAARRVFYKWFADPLQTLVHGSRKVAAGNFDHRIELKTGDEIGELANAMNAMTNRFREIRDDLDKQVQERTNEVVRSEQLASVGFLAAGVSHEINNPLASIALCSESLEGRLQDLLDGADPAKAEDVQVARNYLQMIQREAFRCKQITEKLLDFARRGDSQRHATELRDLAAGVIDMVQHLGQYQDKRLELVPGPPVIADVNAQEIKQVVLNLITNGLESLDVGGVVRVSVERDAAAARVIIEDDGCGMSDEVRKHLFEPFFTRRRSGQGTGLGLSITHRIVEEHRGRIDATSDGPGRGSRFVVTLPASSANKETHHRYQAA
ncbi:MAG: HAMP domain-containing histidine kinase [Pirellulales bacterium]|nr:HAMP domain-containing histidine kinase [Pirellulales bacterium]